MQRKRNRNAEQAGRVQTQMQCKNSCKSQTTGNGNHLAYESKAHACSCTGVSTKALDLRFSTSLARPAVTNNRRHEADQSEPGMINLSSEAAVHSGAT